MMKNILKNTAAYCDKLILCLLLATVVVIPLFFDIRLYSVFDFSKVMSLYLLTVAVLVVWAILLAVKQNFRFFHTAIDIPILSYIFIFVISSIISINPIISLLGAYKRFEGLMATLCYIFIFYATVNFVTTKKRVYLFMMSIVSCAAISSIYGIIQRLGFDVFKWSSSGPRVFSSFGNPVFFSAQLVVTLPLAATVFFMKPLSQTKGTSLCTSKNPPIVWIFLIVALVIYTTFWFTNTRACFFALIGGFVLFLFFVFKRIKTEGYKFVALVVSFTLVGVFFNLKHENSIVKRFTERFEEDRKMAESLCSEKGINKIPVFDEVKIVKRPWVANRLPQSESAFSRIFQYLAAIEIVKDYPVLGIGPDTLGIVYQKYLSKIYSVQEGDTYGFPFPRQDRIHNDVLDTTATRGILGLGTYIWLLAAFGIYVGKNYKRLSRQDKILILGLSSGIVSYLIQNEFSFGNTPIVTLFWVMMGLCISIIKINEKEGLGIENCGPGKGMSGIRVNSENKKSRGKKSEHPQVLRRAYTFYRWLGCGSVLLAMGFVTVFVVRFYRADVYFEYGRRILDYERASLPAITEKGLYFIKYAIRLNPYETFYRDELCRTYIQNALRTKDEVWVQKAYIEANNSLKLIPQHFMGFFHLGMIYQMLDEHFGRNTVDLAIDSYKKAIDSDPFQAPFHSNLASLYINQGKQEQAIEELYKAYLIRPDELNHLDRLSNAYLQKGDLEKAFFFSKKIIAQNPSESGYYNNYGALLSKKGVHEESINSFKKAIELNPKEPIYLDNLTRLYISLEKYDESIPYYKKLIELNPAGADTYNNLGTVYRKKKQPLDAIPLYRKAIEIKPDNPVYTYNLASVYVDLGKYGDAKKVLSLFEKTYAGHNYINISLLLANIYSQETDWEKVVSSCNDAIKIDEKSISAYKLLSIAYYNMHQYKLAEKILDKLISLDPNDQGAKDLLVKISNTTKR